MLHELLGEHEWYTVFAAICAIERSLLNVTWSGQVIEANLIAHHVFHGGVSAGVGLFSQIYVSIVFKNLWRKSFTASAKTCINGAVFLMFRKFTNNFELASIAKCISLLFILQLLWQGELAGLVAHPLLQTQCLKSHGRKGKWIARAHSINLIDIFNRTDESLT